MSGKWRGENQERKRKEGREAIAMVQVRNDGGLDEGVGSGGGGCGFVIHLGLSDGLDWRWWRGWGPEPS